MSIENNHTSEPLSEPTPIGDLLPDLEQLIGHGLPAPDIERKVQAVRGERGDYFRDIIQRRKDIVDGLAGQDPDEATAAELDRLEAEARAAFEDTIDADEPPR